MCGGVEGWNRQRGCEGLRLDIMKHLSDDSGLVGHQDEHGYIYTDSWEGTF